MTVLHARVLILLIKMAVSFPEQRDCFFLEVCLYGMIVKVHLAKWFKDSVLCHSLHFSSVVHLDGATETWVLIVVSEGTEQAPRRGYFMVIPSLVFIVTNCRKGLFKCIKGDV